MTTEQTTSPPRAGVGIAAQGLGQSVRSGRQILTDISLSIAPGELVAIIGASGAGKTTLLEILAGVQRPAAGTVTYDGSRRGRHHRCRSAGRHHPPRAAPGPHPALRRPTAPALRHRAGRDQSTGSRRCSPSCDSPTGPPRRSACSAAVNASAPASPSSCSPDPRVFFLDEPTSGLDPAIAVELLRVLRALADTGATVVLTTHQITDVDHCDRVVVLTRQGRLAFTGTPDRRPGVLRPAVPGRGAPAARRGDATRRVARSLRRAARCRTAAP